MHGSPISTQVAVTAITGLEKGIKVILHCRGPAMSDIEFPELSLVNTIYNTESGSYGNNWTWKGIKVILHCRGAAMSDISFQSFV